MVKYRDDAPDEVIWGQALAVQKETGEVCLKPHGFMVVTLYQGYPVERREYSDHAQALRFVQARATVPINKIRRLPS